VTGNWFWVGTLAGGTGTYWVPLYWLNWELLLAGTSLSGFALTDWADVCM